jgi:hypothetical protein
MCGFTWSQTLQKIKRQTVHEFSKVGGRKKRCEFTNVEISWIKIFFVILTLSFLVMPLFSIHMSFFEKIPLIYMHWSNQRCGTYNPKRINKIHRGP